MSVPTYFFLDDVLHKKLRVIVSENVLVAWNYPDEKRLWLDHSWVKKNYQKAYKLVQVAELIGRSKNSLADLLDRKLVRHPSGKAYRIHNRMPSTTYWSEDDVLDLRDQLYALTPKNKYNEPYRGFKLISKAELLAKMRGDSGLYVKNEEGEFVKIWKAI